MSLLGDPIAAHYRTAEASSSSGVRRGGAEESSGRRGMPRSSVFLNFSTAEEGHLPNPSALSNLSLPSRIAAGFVPPDCVSAEPLPWAVVRARHGPPASGLVLILPGYQYEAIEQVNQSSTSILNSESQSESSALSSSSSSSFSIPEPLPVEQYTLAFPEHEVSAYLQWSGNEQQQLFLGLREDADSEEAPVVVSLEPADADAVRAAVFCCFGELRTIVSADVPAEDLLRGLEQEFPELFRGSLRWISISALQTPLQPQSRTNGSRQHVTLAEALADYDRKQRALLSAFKIGVVCSRPGDMRAGDDQALYRHQEPSEAFSEFLGVLGTR
ncbi:MAG: hypothetical protein Q8P67_14260, partial [archaeon]|nr:hypothetical protein [archaeon]